MFEIAVRYAAIAVLVAEGEEGVAVATSAESIAVKGSVPSVVGELRGGVGSAEDGMNGCPFSRRLVDLFRLPLPVGEARRESVFRKLDLRFGGTTDAGSMGTAGIFWPGWASRSFRSSSTTSMAVRVRVRLWVGVLM